MVSVIAQWTLDVQDVPLMVEFWSQALGYRSETLPSGETKLRPPDDGFVTMLLQPVAGPKNGKNRNHPDLTAPDGDVDAEVERLIGLGARRVDVGQEDTDPFVVLADPEGNEFCLLRP